MLLTAGTVIGGHYIIGDLINRGGFGAVYRGVDTSEGNRLCALKETYDVTPAARRQALMEASILFTVRSPHLPEVYDALEDHGRFYLIMQFVEGQNLLQLLQQRLPGLRIGEQQPYQAHSGPCTEQEVLNWLLPIIDVLQELHSRKPPILHRDIKAGNIIITPEQKAVLVDFGLTKLYDPTRGTQTLVKAVSEGFSSLEQYIGQTSPRSDLYSMAATMYLLLTNRLPPPAVTRSVQDELISPRLLNPLVSQKMERVLLKALAVHPDDRYGSMHDFAQALMEPEFTAHADQTILGPSLTSLPIVPSPAPLYLSAPHPAAPAAYPGPPVAYNPYNSSTVQSSYPAFQPGGYSSPIQVHAVYPQLPAHPPVSPRYGAPSSPQPRMVSLPNPTDVGCAWGLLQGMLSALIVLFLREPGAFILAWGLGLLFYVWAGMRATRKGGSVLRGGWAGYWAGILGTISFWITLGIGLVVRVSLRANDLNKRLAGQPSNEIVNQAWRDVQPIWPKVLLFARQPLWINVGALLLAGLVVAWLCGWLGGLIRRLRSSGRPQNGRRP
ncbi:hypothetical protein KTT_19940 [Tengunoibacter tsumagoiensis]|uniref:non-specific serine/threonine protein kinase n=1 Tax=Tengunoibacter tsumagoiensis TaxID=2014871 RepID=A0A401ZZ69_9CHLR|nr:hypothetical protein KTT_19940 [Tengunoibacter tsumagoiensis]